MAQNKEPIFPKVPKIGMGKVLTANTAKDGTGAVVEVFDGGVEGARIDQIKVRALGGNVATVLRFFVNNGLTNATPANNSLVHEVTIATTTVSEVAALVDNDITITKGGDVVPPIQALPPGYKLYVTVGTTIAAGLQVTVSGGAY